MNETRIEAEAAEWIIRADLGLTPAEQDQFLEWLTADPRHREELLRQRANWQALDILADWRPEHATEPNRDLLAPRPASWWRARRTRTLTFALAAAAALLLGFFRWHTVPPPAAPAPIQAIEERTLEDGSTVVMNRGTDLTVEYSLGLRRVRLSHGEATFTVTKNPSRPFIVSVGDINVRAVGTAFNVRRALNAVEVLVTEGRVAVLRDTPATPSTAAEPQQVLASVGAGERAVLPLGTASPVPVGAVTPAEREALLAWQPQWLDFTAEPLQRVVAELNRRNTPVRLVIVDAELADLKVSATLRSDNIENFVRLAETSLGVQVQREGQNLLLRKAPR